MSETLSKPQTQPEPESPEPSELDLVLGQVSQSLSPTDPDPLKARAVLEAAVDLGYDPRALYSEAISRRPPEYDPAPLLSEVLPPEVLEVLDELDSEEQSRLGELGLE